MMGGEKEDPVVPKTPTKKSPIKKSPEQIKADEAKVYAATAKAKLDELLAGGPPDAEYPPTEEDITDARNEAENAQAAADEYQAEADAAAAAAEPEPEPETNEEVFQVKGYQFSGPAQGLGDAGCIKYGGIVATKDQVYAAQAAGADWCSTGWTRDHPTPMYPINTSLQQGCGNGAAQVVEYKPPNTPGYSYPLAALNCYGVKPVKTTPVDGVTVFEKLHNWNDEKWSKYD
jgi:hypothetical protein